MAGDPDLETTRLALKALDEAGADIIELGIPYSVNVFALRALRVTDKAI